MDFTFHMPVRILSGEGCLRQGGDSLRALGRRCVIVTGGHGAAASGALDDALAVCAGVGIEATVWPAISANPLLSQCQAAAFAAEAWRADFLLGIGGGSVLDATKAAAWLAANNISDGQRLFRQDLRYPPLPFALVGTTAGTGSEVSATAVLTNDATGRKQSITHPACYARLVFADPRYTDSLPRAETVSTALDALAHTVEGWFAPACSDIVTACAEQAMPLICDGLRTLAAATFQHAAASAAGSANDLPDANRPDDTLPDAATRDRLFYGSLWAGMVLNATGTAFPHPMGYVLTEDFGVPHGMACAIFLPAFLERAEREQPARAARLFTLGGGRDACYTLLRRLVHADIRMTAAQMDAYAARWTNVKNFARTPGGYTSGEARALLQTLFGNEN